MKSWRPTTISTATANVMSGNHPTASRPPIATLAVSMPPGFRRWESAEKTSSSRFWMMTDSPKVTRTGGRMPEHLLLEHPVPGPRAHDRRLDVAARGEPGILRRLAAGQDLPALVTRDLPRVPAHAARPGRA